MKRIANADGRGSHALAVLVMLLFAGCNSTPTTCASSRHCPGQVCDIASATCVDCSTSVDCPEAGQVCQGNRCVVPTPCVSSRQCPDAVCDTTRGFCVDCVTALDCDPGETCESSRCVSSGSECVSDRQCSGTGRVCDPARGVCVDCVRDADCTAGAVCQANVCVAAVLDAGPIPVDVGPRDAGLAGLGHVGMDGGVGGALDAGGVDSGGADSGGADSGGTDSGGTDSGFDAGGHPGSSDFHCVDARCRGMIVISELRTDGVDEFVEIYNRSGVSVNVDGLMLFYRSQSGTTGVRSTVRGETIIPPGRYLLFASADYTGPGPVDVAERWSGLNGLANGGGSVYIQAGSDIIDLVGWGGADLGIPGSETTAFVPEIEACVISCERKANASSTQTSMMIGADAFAGNGYDSNDNSADFVQRTVADPQTSASPAEP